MYPVLLLWLVPGLFIDPLMPGPAQAFPAVKPGKGPDVKELITIQCGWEGGSKEVSSQVTLQPRMVKESDLYA